MIIYQGIVKTYPCVTMTYYYDGESVQKYWNFYQTQNFKVPSIILNVLSQPVLDHFSVPCLFFNLDKVSLVKQQLSDAVTDWCLC